MATKRETQIHEDPPPPAKRPRQLPSLGIDLDYVFANLASKDAETRTRAATHLMQRCNEESFKDAEPVYKQLVSGLCTLEEGHNAKWSGYAEALTELFRSPSIMNKVGAAEGYPKDLEKIAKSIETLTDPDDGASEEEKCHYLTGRPSAYKALLQVESDLGFFGSNKSIRLLLSPLGDLFKEEAWIQEECAAVIGEHVLDKMVSRLQNALIDEEEEDSKDRVFLGRNMSDVLITLCHYQPFSSLIRGLKDQEKSQISTTSNDLTSESLVNVMERFVLATSEVYTHDKLTTTKKKLLPNVSSIMALLVYLAPLENALRLLLNLINTISMGGLEVLNLPEAFNDDLEGAIRAADSARTTLENGDLGFLDRVGRPLFLLYCLALVGSLGGEPYALVMLAELKFILKDTQAAWDCQREDSLALEVIMDLEALKSTFQSQLARIVFKAMLPLAEWNIQVLFTDSFEKRDLSLLQGQRSSAKSGEDSSLGHPENESVPKEEEIWQEHKIDGYLDLLLEFAEYNEQNLMPPGLQTIRIILPLLKLMRLAKSNALADKATSALRSYITATSQRLPEFCHDNCSHFAFAQIYYDKRQEQYGAEAHQVNDLMESIHDGALKSTTSAHATACSGASIFTCRLLYSQCQFASHRVCDEDDCDRPLEKLTKFYSKTQRRHGEQKSSLPAFFWTDFEE